MALVSKAAFERDVGEAYSGVDQTTLGRFDTLKDEILVGRQSCRLPERPGKVLAGEAGKFGQVVEADVFREMFADEVAGAAQMSRRQAACQRGHVGAQRVMQSLQTVDQEKRAAFHLKRSRGNLWSNARRR